MLRIYGDSISGNCLKVKWTADHLGLAYDWIETGVLNGQTRTPAFLAMNPAGQVPVVLLADGRVQDVGPTDEQLAMLSRIRTVLEPRVPV